MFPSDCVTFFSQIACGKRHTLALVPSRGRLYAFGLGGSGEDFVATQFCFDVFDFIFFFLLKIAISNIVNLF